MREARVYLQVKIPAFPATTCAARKNRSCSFLGSGGLKMGFRLLIYRRLLGYQDNGSPGCGNESGPKSDR